ncbi:MAG: hypothetical protein MI861_11575 [Pirellulales bacterium]|nr:hypothetical protein [Pirellulales bacterium]
MDTRSSQYKNRLASSVLAVIVIVIMMLVNLPYRYVERDGVWIGSQPFLNNDVYRRLEAMPTMAGWPNRYWVRYEADQGEDRFWSTRLLVTNVAVGLAAAALVFCFSQLRYRVIRKAHRWRLARLLFDGSLAVLILFLPLTIYALAYRTKAHQWRLLQQSRRKGICYVSCWLPEPVANRFPSGLVDVLLRIRDVKLARPPRQLVEQLVKLDSLAGFHFEGGQFDSEMLSPIQSHIHFGTVGVTDTQLDEEFIALVGRLRWVVALNLSNTNLDSSMLRQLDSLPRLRWVDLRGTRIQLSQLGEPEWSGSVEGLRLPRPPSGQADQLTLTGWPKLKTLALVRRSMRLNESPLTMELVGLPNLENIYIDRVQKHEFVGRQLPRLARIDEDTASLFFALGPTDAVPGLPWFSRLEMEEVSSLKRIGCFARDLKSLSIQDAPSLRYLEVGAYQVLGGGMAKLESIDVAQCQAWIEGLGRGNGPVTVDLTALPLAGIDLAPLAANPRIRQLRLTNTGVQFEQVQGLAGMDQLEKLDLGDCLLKQNQLQWLLDQLPNLRELSIDGTYLESVHLTRNDDLRLLKTTPFEHIRELKLIDVPDLDSSFHLVCSPRLIVIRDAQSLRGIAVEGPWPENVQIEGLRDLEWFSGGGGKLDDTAIDAVMACPELDRLTLAYSSVSRERLAELGKLSKLSRLAVPGSDVDDQVTSNWSSLTKLQELDVSETAVSTQTFRWLAGIESLRRLSIRRMKLGSEAASALSGLVQLVELDVADATLDQSALINMLGKDSLERLNLSGWQLDESLVQAVADNLSLRWLVLRRCQLDQDLLIRLMTDNPRVLLDVGDQADALERNLPENFRQRLREINRTSMMTFGNLLQTPDNFYQIVLPVPRDATQADLELYLQRRIRYENYLNGVPGSINPDQFRSP